jgi:hypothetical protein
LEIRVQRNESRRRIEEWHNEDMSMLSPALVKSNFDLLDIKSAMARIILEHKKNEKIYTYRDASIDDMGVHARFEAYSDQGLRAFPQLALSPQMEDRHRACSL